MPIHVKMPVDGNCVTPTHQIAKLSVKELKRGLYFLFSYHHVSLLLITVKLS